MAQMPGPQNFRGLSLTIGSGITVHGGSLTIGIIRGVNAPDIPAALVENFGTILVNEPGDQLRLGTFAFTNSGTIHLGTNNVVQVPLGDFVQSASGKLQFDLGGKTAGMSHGQFQMPSSRATLDGVLKVNVLAPFQPAVGDVLNLLTYQAHTGAFSDIIQATPGTLTAQWNPEYGPTNFALRFGTPPPP